MIRALSGGTFNLPKDLDGAGLTDSVCARHGLQIILGIKI